jgi:diguanylate cyclase (GGDEF)-like protein
MATYDFVHPALYAATFAKKAEQMGLSIEGLDEKKEIEAAVEKMEQVKAAAHENLSKLGLLARRAKVAIRERNSNEFEVIEAEIYGLDTTLKKLETQVYTDGLTGLLNRRGLRHYAGPKETGMQLDGAMYVFDFDRFKEINDVHGYPIGDALLKAFAQKIFSAALANIPADRRFFGRFAGDVFVVVVDESNMTYVETLLRKTQQAGIKAKLPDDTIITASFSFGGSSFKKGGAFDEVFANADKDMRLNKTSRKEKLKSQ